MAVRGIIASLWRGILPFAVSQPPDSKMILSKKKDKNVTILRLTPLFTFVFILLFSTSSSAQSTNVPLEHWSYDLLERFKAKGYIEDFLDSTKPFSRKEIARAVAQVVQKVSEGAPATKTDRELLRELEVEFAEELSQIGTQVAGPPRWHLYPVRSRTSNGVYSWKDSSSCLVVDPVLKVGCVRRTGDVGSSPDRIFITVVGGTVRGALKGSLGFYLNARETQQKGNRPFSSYTELNREHGLPIVLTDQNSVSYDETDAYLTLPCRWFQLEFGKQFHDWGPGYWGNLTLSNYAPSFEALKIKARYGHWKFVWLTGALRTDLPEYSYNAPYSNTPRKVRKQKYIAAHRLEFAPHPRIAVGINEAIIYGERGIEPGYLIPTIFFWSEQHYIYGDDNATIGADIAAYPLQGLKLYSEVFIDDLSLKHFDLSRPDNKWAILGGIFLVDPFGIPDSDFRMEYVRVEPYVYTHRIPINVYRNHGYVLGHWISPNSDGLFSEFNYRFSRGLLATLSFRRLRHGRNIYENGEMIRNVGGDIDFPIEYKSSGRKRFLDGILERESTFGFRLSYRTFQDLFLIGEFDYTRTEDQTLGASEKSAVMFAVGYNFYQ